MQSALTRYAIIVMLVIGFGASVYACGRATDTTRGETRLEKLAIGDMERMDFAFRGENAPTTATARAAREMGRESIFLAMLDIVPIGSLSGA